MGIHNTPMAIEAFLAARRRLHSDFDAMVKAEEDMKSSRVAFAGAKKTAIATFMDACSRNDLAAVTTMLASINDDVVEWFRGDPSIEAVCLRPNIAVTLARHNDNWEGLLCYTAVRKRADATIDAICERRTPALYVRHLVASYYFGCTFDQYLRWIRHRRSWIRACIKIN